MARRKANCLAYRRPISLCSYTPLFIAVHIKWPKMFYSMNLTWIQIGLQILSPSLSVCSFCNCVQRYLHMFGNAYQLIIMQHIFRFQLAHTNKEQNGFGYNWKPLNKHSNRALILFTADAFCHHRLYPFPPSAPDPFNKAFGLTTSHFRC